jgi:beta-lactamase regulating signal transducer with metallopeptidase domain/predicted  nucleic acid-binding Zn-ribbon protein
MDSILVFGLGSLKALLLLVVASGIALALRSRPARLRAVIWATALVGSLLIPLVSNLVPSLSVELPVELPRITAPASTADPPAITERSGSITLPSIHEPAFVTSTAPTGPRSRAFPGFATIFAAVWVAVVLLLLLHQGLSLLRMSRIISRAHPVDHSESLAVAATVREQVGCRREIRLVWTSEIDIPSVFGVFHPVIVLPAHFRSWLEDRLQAVLQHETIHVIRFDWPLRIAARVARAVYWFNPLAWWATRRLDLEQELACDEEVLSLGSRASSYACHLLGIAHVAVGRPAPASAGLAMARRSHLEERIMRILSRSKHRKVGLAVILPAALLTAALVPAIAAVQPTEPAPKKASPELKAALAEMEEAEKRIEPYVDRIHDVEIDMAPMIEAIEAIEIDIDHEAIARIEAEMEPIIARIEAIEIDMEPYHEQIEAMHDRLESMTFHIDDGTLEEVQRQIREQMEGLHDGIGSIHIDMAPYQEQIAELHAQLEPLHEKISELTAEQLDRVHEQMEEHRELMGLEREQMFLMQERMEQIHEEMRPFETEMELMGVRIESALVSDVSEVLRTHLGPVSSPGAPYTEAAARIIDEGDIHIHDDVLELRASDSEVREILRDLFAAERVGTQDAFATAIEEAVEELSELTIVVE